MSEDESGLVLPRQSLEVPVSKIEGEYVRAMVGKLPSLTMDMEVGYTKGTLLRLEVLMRVAGWGVYDLKRGREQIPTRVHTLAYEDVKLIGAYAVEEEP